MRTQVITWGIVFAGSPAFKKNFNLNSVSGSAFQLIGNTSLLELTRLSSNLNGKVHAKAEFQNPSGSIKDRMVHYALNMAESRCEIKPGDTIVEASSGNTGVALSMMAAVKGYQAVIVIPDTTSRVKIKMMKAYGAEVIVTSASEGVNAAVLEAKSQTEKRGAFLLNQFKNPDNVKAHHRTGQEILVQAGKVDAFVAGVGTGGTLIGVAEALKQADSSTRIIAVEPLTAPAFYNMYYGEDLPIGDGIPHSIEGIGETFVPEILQNNIGIVDGVILVSDENAFKTRDRLAVEEGLFAGISSGANVWASMQVASELEPDDCVVTVLPDTGQRYLD